MKNGENYAIIGSVIGLLLGVPLLNLISKIMGEDTSNILMIGLFLLLGIMFICLSIWVFKQKRYFTVVTSIFISVSWFMLAYGIIIDNDIIFNIGFDMIPLFGGAFYFSIIRFNKKHGINR